jgi:hypothetical protein
MAGMLGIWGQPIDFVKSLKDKGRLKNPAEPPGMATTKAAVGFVQAAIDQDGQVTKNDVLALLGGTAPGAKQLSDVARNVFDEPLYEAQNDVKTLRNAAMRWANRSKLDVPKRSAIDLRKSANSPVYEPIYEALLVGDADRARVLADKFIGGEKNDKEARAAVKQSVKGRQPFRVGPFTNTEYKTGFMTWAARNLPKKDYQQAQRVQDRYEAAAKKAGLW